MVGGEAKGNLARKEGRGQGAGGRKEGDQEAVPSRRLPLTSASKQLIFFSLPFRCENKKWFIKKLDPGLPPHKMNIQKKKRTGW